MLALAAAYSASTPALDMPVSTLTGLVSGTQLPTGISAFKGIPFALPPVGRLRWRAPRAPARWDGIRNAERFAPACAQGARPPRAGPPEMGEDCLYLNVWTAAPSAAAKLPVLVWIYGGGFQWGFAGDPRFDGEHLASKGVVLVTIAYRVGALGFLVHPELTRESPHHASGNYGILDQIAALSWIRRNIASFGGDPTNITIFGESAGSTAVNILQASPLAKGLFRRAIGESTSQMDAAAGLPGREDMARAEQSGLRYQSELGAHSLAELRALPVSRLTDSKQMFWPLESDGYVLPDTVYAIFAAGKQNSADLLVGANADEGAILRRNWIEPRTPAQKAAFHALYGKENSSDRQSDTDTVLWQMWSWADLNARISGRHSYLYWFTQSPPISPSAPLALPGPVHGAEIPYVFDNLAERDAPWTDADRRLADSMSTYWTNFAKTGNPNRNGLPEWPIYDTRDSRVMQFEGESPKAIAMPRRPNVQFIESYFDYMRRKDGQIPSQ